MGARFEQLVQRVDLARHGGGAEVVHAFKGDVQAQVAFAGQLVGHVERDAWLHGLEARVEVVDIHFEELAIGHGCQRLGGLAGEVRHDAHDEGQLDLFLGAVKLDVVLDLHSRRTVARDEFLRTLLRHVAAPGRSSDGVGVTGDTGDVTA